MKVFKKLFIMKNTAKYLFQSETNFAIMYCISRSGNKNILE